VCHRSTVQSQTDISKRVPKQTSLEHPTAQRQSRAAGTPLVIKTRLSLAEKLSAVVCGCLEGAADLIPFPFVSSADFTFKLTHAGVLFVWGTP
jgi:hypothetical protein